MGASSVNQGRVIVAVPTPPALWFYTVHCVTVWPGGGGGGGALCSTQSFRDPGSFHLVAPLYSESLGSSPFNH